MCVQILLSSLTINSIFISCEIAIWIPWTFLGNRPCTVTVWAWIQIMFVNQCHLIFTSSLLSSNHCLKTMNSIRTVKYKYTQIHINHKSLQCKIWSSEGHVTDNYINYTSHTNNYTHFCMCKSHGYMSVITNTRTNFTPIHNRVPC